jgi:predicted nucleotidyltransferase
MKNQRDAGAALQEAAQARDALLARVAQALEADARVTAAWLSGSYGRGEADEWSDLDLHVVVADEHFAAFLDEHETLFAQVGKPVLVLGDLPSDSMPGGRFWLVQYAPYMLEIDWNIGPAQTAERPAASLVLLDRGGVPVAPPPSSISEEQRRNEASTQLALFWAMTSIAIKFAGRGHTRRAVNQVRYLEEHFCRLWYAVHAPERLPRDVYHQNRPLEADLDARLPRFGPSIDPLAALAVIRQFCHEVTSLHPALADLGVAVDDAAAQETAALADLAEIVACAGGSNPDRGSRR